jgi:hypothetical protein
MPSMLCGELTAEAVFSAAHAVQERILRLFVSQGGDKIHHNVAAKSL